MAETKAWDSIEAAFEEARGAVPYATFMKCFNRLLDDPAELEPKAPSEDLKPCFKAVCMAFDLGIRDEQGRDEDRRKEFFDNIYPVWREQMPSGQFHHFDQILEGTSELKGSKRADKQRQRQMEKAERALDSALKEAGVEDLNVDDIAPDLDDIEPQPEAEETEEAPAAEEAGEVEEEEEEEEEEEIAPVAPVEPIEEEAEDHYPSLSKVVKALESGDIEAEFVPADSKDREPLATCTFHGSNVELRLMESEKYRYVLLKCDSHGERNEALMERVKKILARRGFSGPKKYAFTKSSEKSDYRVEVGEGFLRLAMRAQPKVLKADKVPGAVRALGKLLENILRDAIRVSG